MSSPIDAPSESGESDAVVVRSVLAIACSLRLSIGDHAADLMGAHTALPDGTVVLAVDALTPLGGRLVAQRGRPEGVRLDVTSLVPVPVRCRVRARVTLTGTVRPFDPARLDGCDSDTALAMLDLPPVALWAVDPDAVRLARQSGGAVVGVAAYRAARPDPLAAVEADHLERLHRLPGAAVQRLTALAEPALAEPALAEPALARAGARLVPVAIDAGGLTVRAESRSGHRDARLSFSRRVSCAAELTRELDLLTGRAVPSNH